jgi:hypothetical protein
VARGPLRADEQLVDRVNELLSKMERNPELIRSFFENPSVAWPTTIILTGRRQLS